MQVNELNSKSLRILPITVFIVDNLHSAMTSYGNVAALGADVKANDRHLPTLSTALPRVVVSGGDFYCIWAPSRNKIHTF